MRASLSSTMALCLGLCLGRQAFAAPRATRAWRSLAPEHKSRYVSPRPTILQSTAPLLLLFETSSWHVRIRDAKQPCTPLAIS